MMQAVILAAGKGSRLHPITTNRSKAMLPILGKPIVERVMEGLTAVGIEEFILVVSPEDRHITRYFREQSTLPTEVRFVYQPQRLGSADALRWATPLIEGDFILSACDNLISIEHLQRLVKAWNSFPQPSAVLTLMRVPVEQTAHTGVVALDGEWVSQIIEKPGPERAPSDIASLPLYIFHEQFLDYLCEIQPSPRGEYELQDAIQLLIEEGGKVRGIFTDKRLTLTSPADLLRINRHYLEVGGDGPQIQPQSVGAHTHLITPLYIESRVVIGKGCTIGPEVYIERECQIGDGAQVQRSVVLREAVIPPGAQVIDTVFS